MTGADLFQGIRTILRDTGYGTYSDGRVYAPEEIALALTTARTDALRYLYGVFAIIGTVPNYQGYNAQMSGGGLPPARARITLSKLLRTVALAASPQAAPTVMWKIECAIDGNGKFIHPEPPLLGEVLATNPYQTQLYMRSGNIYCTNIPSTMYYWAECTTAIGDNGTDLSTGTSGLPDSFYNAIKYLACANLVRKERREDEDRYKILISTFMSRLSSLA